MDGNACLAQIVIADGIHAHNSEDAAQHGQLLRRADADRAVALFRYAVERIGFLELVFQFR